MNKSEKTCPICGRIIADPNNKIGLCPICQKKGLGATLSVAGMGFLVKKFGKKFVEAAINLIRNN